MCFAWLNSQNNSTRKKYYYHSHITGVETEVQKGWMTPSGPQSPGVEEEARMSICGWLWNPRSQTLRYAAPLPPLRPLASFIHSSFYSLPSGQEKSGFYFPMSHVVSTMRPVGLPYKEWRGFSVCFECFTSALPRERLHADVSVGQMFHFFHCPLQRNSGNCQDWLLAATQLPYGDPECILESLTQIAAPASAVPEAVNSTTASSGSIRRWPWLAELPFPTGDQEQWPW